MGGVALALMWGESENWRSSWRLVGSVDGTTEATVVLGCRNTGHRANLLNRWRVRTGIRSCDPQMDRCRLIFCGGPVAGPISEAALMSRYAVDELGYRGEVVMEDQSRSTWENVENVISVIEGFDRVKFVSNR